MRTASSPIAVEFACSNMRANYVYVQCPQLTFTELVQMFTLFSLCSQSELGEGIRTN